MVERSIVTIICLFLQLSAAFKSLMYPSLALSPPSLSICVRGVCMCECVHDFKSKNLIEFSDTHKSFECNRLIIFSCGWVINHFGFNLLRCCWFFFCFFFCLFPESTYLLGSALHSVSASQHRSHWAIVWKLSRCFSFASRLYPTSAPTLLTLLSRWMCGFVCIFRVDFSIFIGYQVHFHSFEYSELCCNVVAIGHKTLVPSTTVQLNRN